MFDRYLSPERHNVAKQKESEGGVLLTPAIKDSNKHLRTIAGPGIITSGQE